jgi:hypothetical protein
VKGKENMQPNYPDKETADLLESIFHSLFESSGGRKTPVVAQIDEARLYSKYDEPWLDRQGPDDIVRCWVWEGDSYQLCSVARYLERKEEATRQRSFGLEFVIRRTGPDEVFVAFFHECLGMKDPGFAAKGMGTWVRREGKWIPEQYLPILGLY